VKRTTAQSLAAIKDPEIRERLEREISQSRYRDRVSRHRIHPIEHDLNALIEFVICRRSDHEDTLDAARRALARVNTEAVRFLIAAVRERGTHPKWIADVCVRLEENCSTIETALLLRKRLLGCDDSVN